MNKVRRHFSELTKKEIETMWSLAVDACIEYAESINMGGLSGLPTHDIYTVLYNALYSEWEKAKKNINKQK